MNIILTARDSWRYKVLVRCYRHGWTNVPLIGPKQDGRRDCAPGFQASIDAFGYMPAPPGRSLLKRGIELNRRK